MNTKRGMSLLLQAIVVLAVSAAVFFLVLIIYYLLTGKGLGALDFLRNAMRFRLK